MLTRENKIGCVALFLMCFGGILLIVLGLLFDGTNGKNDGNFESEHQRLKTMKNNLNEFRKSNELVIRTKETKLFGKSKTHYDDRNLDTYITMIDEYADELIEVYNEELSYLFTQGTPEAKTRADILWSEFEQEYGALVNRTTDDDMTFHGKGRVLRNNLQSKREVFQRRIDKVWQVTDGL